MPQSTEDKGGVIPSEWWYAPWYVGDPPGSIGSGTVSTGPNSPLYPPNIYAPKLGVEQIVKRTQKALLDEIFQLWDGGGEAAMINFWIEMGYYDENGDYVDRQEA